MKQNKEVVVKESGAKVRRKPIVERLTAERIEELVKAMAGWELSRRPSTIQRVLSFEDSRVAATYGSFVLELGALESQDVNIATKGKKMFVTVSRRGGLAQVDLDFAAKLS